MKEQVKRLLGPADPARGMAIGTGDAEAVLQRAIRDIAPDDVLEPVPRWTRAPGLAVVGAVAAVLVVLGGVAVVLRGAGSPTPATPGATSAAPVPVPTGAACLTVIADHIQPTSYDGKTGRYEYVHLIEGAGVMSQTKDGYATVATTEEIWSWIGSDGFGRIRSNDRDPVYKDEASRRFFAAHPGQLRLGTTTMDDIDVGPLPEANPDAMQRALHLDREDPPANALRGVESLNRGRVLDSAHRAALLRALAGVEGVTCRGTMNDGHGRSGVAVSARDFSLVAPSPGDQRREYLLFDSRTGELLASSGPGMIETAQPKWNTVYLERGYTDTLG